MGDLTALEALHESYIALTAFVFDVTLCIVVLMQGGAKKGARSRFFMVSVVVTASVFLSFFNFFFLHVETGVPDLVTLLFQLASYMANIFVTYFLAVYLAGFFNKDAVRKEVLLFNRILLYVSAALIAGYFLLQAVSVLRGNEVVFVDGAFRVLIGYLVELYYMCYCLQFARKGHELNNRARLTIIAAFAISVISFVMQLVLGARPLVNYLGVSLGLLIFFFSAETPDYHKLQTALAALEEEKKSADEARAQADEANRSKSDFLANMSHEIRTPINAVLGMNEMILREVKQAKEQPAKDHTAEAFARISDYAADVDSAGKGLLSIINDILDFSRIEAGRMELNEEPYHISSLLNDVYNMTFFRAGAKGLSFSAEIDETLPEELLGDEVRIRQILLNLLGNAVKYTDHGSVKLSVRAERVDEHTLHLLIAVRDSGIGIRAEDQGKLFEQFERMDLKRNKAVEGSGLGLAITSSLLQLMNGTIRVDSVYGEGSTFTVSIPQKIVSQNAVGDFRRTLKQNLALTPSYKVSFKAPSAKILAVDDTEINLTVIQGLLKDTQVAIDTALSGERALFLTKDVAYDLILMDQRMPKMSGTEALKQIRAQTNGRNAQTPVICLTADAVQDAKSRYMEEGFTDYLSKPVDGTALEQILTQYLPPEKILSGAFDDAAGQEDAQQTSLRARTAALPEMAYDDALKYLSSDELIETTLRQFYEVLPEQADEIERLWRANDVENLTIRVHALKSSARMLGLNDLSERAAKLEAAGDVLRKEANG